MYAALWRVLPGPAPARALICAILLAIVIAVCFSWVFPWVAERLPVNDPSVTAHVTMPAGTTVR
ncbi:hypothetical protein [Austwickia chelonae]|uniref:hypothetical protein n=1 Tax=Austwickia chelonae TaxID=100225 RepID=UPI000E24C92B|nr:hypothetical protein [Austwickia chelonae]